MYLFGRVSDAFIKLETPTMGRKTSLFFQSIFVYLFLALWLGAAYAESPSVLFIGNSYTYGNNLDEISGTLLEKGAPDWAGVSTKRYAVGGARFSQHLAQANGTNGETELSGHFSGTGFTGVILQEQSQIPGFPQTNEMYTESSDAFVGLNDLVIDNGAYTMALMTWGRRQGDTQNLIRYPDFKTMQGHLKDGYFQYANRASTDARAVVVIPAGLAFEKIYDDMSAAGENPLSDSSLFWKLYSGDGSHPSLQGSYLTACVIFASLTGQTPVGIEWAPEGIDAATRVALQNAAAFVVFDAQYGENTPALKVESAEPEPVDPDSSDSSDSDPEQETGGGDTGADSSDTQGEVTTAAPESSNGSGCAASPVAGFYALISMVFVLRKTRRHRRL